MFLYTAAQNRVPTEALAYVPTNGFAKTSVPTKVSTGSYKLLCKHACSDPGFVTYMPTRGFENTFSPNTFLHEAVRKTHVPTKVFAHVSEHGFAKTSVPT